MGAYAALFSEIGVVLATTILIGILGGHWLDGILGTNPVFVLTGMVLGTLLGGAAAYRFVTRFLARIEMN
ncbi:MAG: AtpZ/AtpI family protein [Candidatus Limnocylindrales bacterium]